MLLGALGLSAVAGVLAALFGGVLAGVLLACVLNLSAALGRLAFESIVQRDAPEANRGRAFARFETRFQLGWAVAGLIPVVINIPGPIGFLLVGVVCAAAFVNYAAGTRWSGLRKWRRPRDASVRRRRLTPGGRARGRGRRARSGSGSPQGDATAG
jgi:hypothetical protein